MRLFEALLSISCFMMLSSLVLTKKTVRKNVAAAILGVISLGILAAQLLVEGYRWQMGIVYALSFICICYWAAGFLSGANRLAKIRRRWFKYVTYAAAVLLLSVSVCLSALLPVVRFPEPGGKYQVGTKTFHFVDENREEIFTDNPADHRELMVRVWYPADKLADGRPEPLLPHNNHDFDAYIGSYAKQIGIPSWLLSYWKYIDTHSYPNAKAVREAAPYPLVILSHGMGTGMVLHASQAENLASHGYVVAAIDHTYSTLATVFPDGRVTDYRTVMDENHFWEQGRKIGKVWSGDVRFVLDKLAAVNSGAGSAGLEGMMDMKRIGIMGHSFGGATAFDASYTDDRIKAGIDMDGTVYELEGREAPNKPFLFMRAGDYIKNMDILKNDKNIDKTSLGHLEKEFSVSKKAVEHGGNFVEIDGAGHYNFTDLQLFSPLLPWTGMTGALKGSRGAEIVDRYVLEFFDEHLKGNVGTLLKGPNEAYPEVRFYGNASK
ncbi:Platelet-activating factor acetylhydrolase plasma/intracellular isoform II [Paenibacillus sp. VCA1]|uniref:alpha/beta hydrolase family protein n=1 Tax=Paenibacillus sp. VCA1 TaxID=3039148 RepID=UPI002870D4F9|nr:Platelet-activating factor acetylhydrolase plasma/intracellular isoform II [Paenibacillus sp. VCA1]MDR9854189.1 Platelet-activating factor acetylhydrolase plasma/intracellular isoform II [Paenibacillus sp. VCA1]